jgi:hypothetical protein
MPEAERRQRIRSAEVVWALNLLWPGLGNYYASGWSNIRWLLCALVLYVAAKSRVLGNLDFALWATAYLALSLLGHVAVRRHNCRLTADWQRAQRRATDRQPHRFPYATRRFEEKFRQAGKLMEMSGNAEGRESPAEPVGGSAHGEPAGGTQASALASGSAPPAMASPDEHGRTGPAPVEYGPDSSLSSPAGSAPRPGQATEEAGGARISSLCLSCGAPRNELRFSCPQCGQFYDL